MTVRKVLSFAFQDEMNICAVYLSGTAPNDSHMPETFFSMTDISKGRLMNSLQETVSVKPSGFPFSD